MTSLSLIMWVAARLAGKHIGDYRWNCQSASTGCWLASLVKLIAAGSLA